MERPALGRVARYGVVLLALGLVSSVAVAWVGGLYWRVGWPAMPLTTLWIDTHESRVAQHNHWRLLHWRDTTATRRVGFAWREEWFADPLLRTWRRNPIYTWDDAQAAEPIDLPAWSLAHTPPPMAAPVTGLLTEELPVFAERACGWPMRCLRVRWVPGDTRIATPGERLRGGLSALPWGWWPLELGVLDASDRQGYDAFEMERHAALPLTPMWGGLVVNTLAWALGWALVLALTWAGLRWPLSVRLRRLVRKRHRRGQCVRCQYTLEPADDPWTTCPECAWILGRVPSVPRRVPTPVPVLALAAVSLLAAGFAVNRVALADRLPALHAAAAHGRIDRVREELARGGRVDARTPRNFTIWAGMAEQTPLGWAAARGHAAVVRELLAAGADPDGSASSVSPLALAVAYGHRDVADALLASGASPSAWTRGGLAPMSIALLNNDRAAFEQLLAHAPSPGLDPLAFALAGRDDALQRRVLAVATYTPDDLAAAARGAVRYGDLVLFERLREMGLDPSLHAVDLYASALDSEAPLAAFEALRASGADPLAIDADLNTLLHHAALAGTDPAVVDRLLDLGVGIDARNTLGQTALHVAAQRGHAAVVRALVHARADPLATDNQDNTAAMLWYRAWSHDPSYHGIRELLRAAEADRRSSF